METYLTELLSEERGQLKDFVHSGPGAKSVRVLDSKAIKLLQHEDKVLGDVTAFFKKVVKYYSTKQHANDNAEKRLLADATLMKALGRILWKVTEAIREHNKTRATQCRVHTVIPVDKEKNKKVELIMNNLAIVEARYRKHLDEAGAFSGGGRTKPLLLTQQKKPTEPGKEDKAMSHNNLPQKPVEVKL